MTTAHLDALALPGRPARQTPWRQGAHVWALTAGLVGLLATSGAFGQAPTYAGQAPRAEGSAAAVKRVKAPTRPKAKASPTLQTQKRHRAKNKRGRLPTATPKAAAAPSTAAQSIGPSAAGVSGDQSIQFEIQKGETLSTFAESKLITSKVWPEIARLNKLRNPHVLTVGQQISVPTRFLKMEHRGAKVVSATGETSAQQGSTLEIGKPLKVGANSSAVIELADQSKVKLLPGSVAELVRNGAYTTRNSASAGSNTWFAGVVRLVQGKVEVLASKAKRSEDLKVVLPTAVVGVRGTVFRAAVIDDKLSSTEVVEGLVNAQNLTQKTAADVRAGFGLVINPAVKEMVPVALLPAPDLSGVPEQLARPSLTASFAAVPGAVSYRIQIASDAEFNQVISDAPSTTPAISFAGIADGIWHVRAKGVDANKLEGLDRTKQIRLSTPPPPPPPPAPRAESVAGETAGTPVISSPTPTSPPAPR